MMFLLSFIFRFLFERIAFYQNSPLTSTGNLKKLRRINAHHKTIPLTQRPEAGIISS
jgi:hypothetical protein